MDRAGKLYQDEMTVEKYRQQLRAELKVIGQKAVDVAVNQRRARELALGQCAMKMVDAVKELKAGGKYRIIPETLSFMIREYVNYPNGERDRKQFAYEVMYQVTVEEPAYTEERIGELCADLEKRLKIETDEMFPEDGKEE